MIHAYRDIVIIEINKTNKLILNNSRNGTNIQIDNFAVKNKVVKWLPKNKKTIIIYRLVIVKE